MIQPIICELQSNRDQVRRLVRYIKELDGTDVKVIPISPEQDAAFVPEYPRNEKACRASFSLNVAAKAMNGKPFIWLEPDSVPLKAGWADALSREYRRVRKSFLLSSDSNPPHDVIGGIGVYSGEAEWMIPTSFQKSGWDLWMLKNLEPLIARTPLIQHSYGHYDQKGEATPWRFPKDSALLRSDALIFHRDPHLDLIQPDSERSAAALEKVWVMAGDLGDIVYSLEVIRRLGGGKLMLGSEMGFRFPSRCREEMTPSRVANIRPLLIAQSYITGVEHFTGQPNLSWNNLNLFRQIFKGGKGPGCTSLQRAMLRRFGLSIQDETTPWLAAPAAKNAPVIAVARSPRYHDPAFPWLDLVQQFGAEMAFIGLDSEYAEFCKSYGKIKRFPTKTMLDVASGIAGAKLFIGNQSCPYAIAEGLKKPSVLETWREEPNCLFQRHNLLNMTADSGKISEFVRRIIG